MNVTVKTNVKELKFFGSCAELDRGYKATDPATTSITYRWLMRDGNNHVLLGIHITDDGDDKFSVQVTGTKWEPWVHGMVIPPISKEIKAVRSILDSAERFGKGQATLREFCNEIGAIEPYRIPQTVTKKDMISLLSSLDDNDEIQFWNKSTKAYMDFFSSTVISNRLGKFLVLGMTAKR